MKPPSSASSPEIKEVWQPVLVLAILALLPALSSAVLTGYEKSDVTSDPRFGCVWQGGSSAAVVCNCREPGEEMYIRENSISSYDTGAIEIANCDRVRFGPRSVAEMRNLRHIRLRNIRRLEFEQASLLWYGYRDKQDNFEERYDMSVPSLKISVENSNVSRIAGFSFEGRINTIYFDNVIVDTLESFAFNALLQTQTIVLRNAEIRDIRLTPFKKFTTANLELDGVKIHLVPSRLFSDITVLERFIINNCTFDTVRPGAFLIHNPRRFDVTSTRINHLDGEAFKVTTKGDVLFRSNVFNVINDGAFSAIRVNKDELTANSKPVIVFDSNLFAELTRDSLSVSDDFSVQFSQLNINETCDCRSIDHKIKDDAFYAEIKCLHNGEFITVKDFKASLCSLMASYSTTIVIVVVVVTLCIIIGTLLVLYYKKVYLSKKYGSEKNAKGGGKGTVSLIVPDGRTYRETELHVIVERADLLTTDL